MLGRIATGELVNTASTCIYYSSKSQSMNVYMVDWRYLYTDYKIGGLGGDKNYSLTKKEGNTLYWYDLFSNINQFNQEDYEYFWICFG